MAIYEFEDREGNRIEREYRAGDCPRRITQGGRVYRKVISRCNFICDGANSKWENDRHRETAVREAKRTAKALKENPDAYPVTIGKEDGGKTPEFVRSEFDWARKH